MNYKNVFGGAKNVISEKKLSNILKKHPFDKTIEENDDVKEVEKSATKKRKSMVPEQTETAGTKRLKRLKDISNEDQNEEKITVKLSKGAKASPQKKTISYEEQAANYANSGADKLDAFKYTDNGSKKADANKFKFVDDTDGPKKNKTLDDWKQKADAKTTAVTKNDVQPKAPEPKEKQTVIDPKAYFAMFSSAQKPKKTSTPEAVPVPQPQVEKDAIEIEQEEEPTHKVDPPLHQGDDDNPEEIQKNNEKETTFISQNETTETTQGHATTQETQNYVPTTQEASTKQETLSQNLKPFAGLSFGVVGEMNSVTQKEIINILESLGAEITDDIDEYVWGLVVGSCLEDGRDVEKSVQYDMAIKNEVKIYTEIEFDEYLLQETGKRIQDFTEKKQPEKTPAKPAPKTQLFSPAPVQQQTISLPMNMASASKPQADRMIIENKNMNESASKYRPLQPASTPQKSQPQSVKKNDSSGEKLWTDKHAPTSIADIIGNQDIVRNLMMWLKDWDDVHIQGNKKASGKFDNRKGKDAWAQSNVNAKGCLVSGPPGIGKTTSVRLIAKHMGYEVIEQNASDVRNKVAVEGLLNHLTDNTLVSFSKQKASTNKKFLILMDEVDGMSSGDRGGNQVLINAIKNTKAPIICVCNDRQHQKVRSLANHCYDLRFQKPPKRNVAQRLAEIARREKLNIDLTALEYLCESFGNDIRQTVNYLQLHAKRSNTLTFNDAKASLTKSSKDRNVMMGNFEAAKLLLSGTNELQLREKIDLFFIDYDMIPLLVHENYLPNSASASYGDLEWIARSSSYLADGDILCQSVKKNGEWGLLPNYAFLGAVYPCDIMCTQVQWPKFPEWLGKNSSQRKKTREVREIRALTAPESLANFSDILFDCAQSYLDLINFNLQTNDKAGVETVVDILDSYNLTPEIMKEHLVDIQISSSRDPFAGVSTQTKTLLTKTYNAKHKSSVKAAKPKKNVGGGDSQGGLKRFNEEADDAEMSDGEDNNDDSVEDDEDKIEIEPAKPTAAPKSSKKSKKGK